MSAASQIPVYDVAFKRRLEGIPNYYVSLLDSLFEITFVDVSQRMSKSDNTVLAVAVSDFYSLPDDNDQPLADNVAPVASNNAVLAPSQCCSGRTKTRGNSLGVLSEDEDYLSVQAQETAKFLILKELNRYVPFKLGEKWGDPKSDVDWAKSFYHSNKDHPLFINEVGCRDWSPKTWDARLPNVYFAGDYVDKSDYDRHSGSRGGERTPGGEDTCTQRMTSTPKLRSRCPNLIPRA